MENVSVSARVRPLSGLEQQESFAWRIDGSSIVDKARDKTYVLDYVFGPDWNTKRIFEVTTKGLIEKAVTGFNITVFAYGQTSSGKTHTMRGTTESPGIIPLAVNEAFSLIENSIFRQFLIRVSYMEIYNEEINDLLRPERVNLVIHECPHKGLYVEGLAEETVTEPERVLELLDSGDRNRHIGETKMNEKSSRSHAIFRMAIESRAVGGEDGSILVSTLTLVDLAGSERASKAATQGARLKEGASINKSLLALGNVIQKLSEGAVASGSHVPYRDSKLTRILEPSLGGNAKTAIICAMSPAWCHREESSNTLRFACRAKRVVNSAVVNERLTDAAMVKRHANEIAELKRQLAAAGSGHAAPEEVNALRAQLLLSEQENEQMRIALQQEQEKNGRIQQDAAAAQREAEIAKKLLCEQGLLGPARTNQGPLRKRALERRQDRAGPFERGAGIAMPQDEDGDSGTEAAEGPAPQRRRRDYGAAFGLDWEAGGAQDEEDGEGGAHGPELRGAGDAVHGRRALQPANRPARQVEETVLLQGQHRSGTQQARAAGGLAPSNSCWAAEDLDGKENAGAAASEAEILELRTKLVELEVDKMQSSGAEAKAKLGEAAAKLQQAATEMSGLRSALQAAKEQAEEAEKRACNLHDEVKRLKAHVQELERRKRAPLYGKKQEEELQVAVEKAFNCEARAVAAELRATELQVAAEGLQTELTQLRKASAAEARRAEKTQEELTTRHTLELQLLRAESALHQKHYDEVVESLKGLREHFQELEAVKAKLEAQLRDQDPWLAGPGGVGPENAGKENADAKRARRAAPLERPQLF